MGHPKTRLQTAISSDIVGSIANRWDCESMFRHFLLIGVATTALSGALAAGGHAQPRGQSRDDLLDALTRHIQICGEISETQQRLACYDRLQTQVGGVAPPAQPTPTPLQASPTPLPAAPPPMASSGSSISSVPLSPQPSSPQSQPQPLSPQPLAVPGGGVATLGSSPSTGGGTASQDPDAAFDPRNAPTRPASAPGPRPQPQMRRTGPRPIPYSSTPQPLVTLGANNLTYGDSRYWQVTVTLTSNTGRTINSQAECTFMNGGRPIVTAYLGPVMIQPGEQITNELIGPPTTTYVDSTNCKVVSP